MASSETKREQGEYPLEAGETLKLVPDSAQELASQLVSKSVPKHAQVAEVLDSTVDAADADALAATKDDLHQFAHMFQRDRQRIPRVLVGLSGGVDSSVCAALLVETGWDVCGAYMKNWTMDVPGMRCPWADDLADAKRVAVRLGIDFRVYDFQEAYKREVVDYLVDEYRAGRTPNPDVMCNQQVKFGLFFDAAQDDGFDYIATGHYARASHDPVRLLRAADMHKDQTYFLYRMSSDAVAHTIFPLGGLLKTQVRAAAEQRNLSTAHKADSQGICFVGEAGIRDFLSLYVHPQPGPIIDDDTGETVGYHDGAIFFTIGQRHGLGIGGGRRYRVVRKDMDHNILYVHDGPLAPVQDSLLELDRVRWIADVPPQEGACEVRTHHGEKLLAATLLATATTATVQLEADHDAVASGQSVVIYRGQECLGGGIVR